MIFSIYVVHLGRNRPFLKKWIFRIVEIIYNSRNRILIYEDPPQYPYEHDHECIHPVLVLMFLYPFALSMYQNGPRTLVVKNPLLRIIAFFFILFSYSP